MLPKTVSITFYIHRIRHTMLRGISWVNIQGTFVNLEFCVHNRGLTFHKLDEVLHILLPNPHADQMKNIWSLCSKNKCLLANYLAQHLCYSPSPPPPFFFKKPFFVNFAYMLSHISIQDLHESPLSNRNNLHLCTTLLLYSES